VVRDVWALGRWMRRFVKRIWIKGRFVAGQSITFCGIDLFCSWENLWSGMFSVGYCTLFLASSKLTY
jgi:hypothetical protein